MIRDSESWRLLEGLFHGQECELLGLTPVEYFRRSDNVIQGSSHLRKVFDMVSVEV